MTEAPATGSVPGTGSPYCGAWRTRMMAMERGTNDGLHPWIWSSSLWCLKDYGCDRGARHRRWALSLDLKLLAKCSKDGGND
uniref:Uncharacterized protein n=1 Tax=Oryza glaberrima TaxID=4538 RepID=I1R0P9_ORYGL